MNLTKYSTLLAMALPLLAAAQNNVEGTSTPPSAGPMPHGDRSYSAGSATNQGNGVILNEGDSHSTLEETPHSASQEDTKANQLNKKCSNNRRIKSKC